VQGLGGLLPLLLIALVFWFLIVRPQRRRQQALVATQSSLDVGSEVMLGSGIYCTVASLEDETIHVELAPGVVVKVARQAVAKVLDHEQDAGLERQHEQHEYGDAPTDLRGDERPGPNDQHQ
jgi:preprotein translocase subunit YajC